MGRPIRKPASCERKSAKEPSRGSRERNHSYRKSCQSAEAVLSSSRQLPIDDIRRIVKRQRGAGRSARTSAEPNAMEDVFAFAPRPMGMQR